MTFFRGSEAAVRRALKRHRAWDDRERDAYHQAVVNSGLRVLAEGAWLINLDEGFRFEVVPPVWDVVQDVYGCAHGRDCRDIDDALRPALEAMVTARTALGLGVDERSFHWYRRLASADYVPDQVRSFALVTMGSERVADVAVRLADNAAAYSSGQAFDVHLTMTPTLLRVRVDDEGGGVENGHDAPVPRQREVTGRRRGGLAFIEEHVATWGAVGQDFGGWSVWADFARSVGDREALAQNHWSLPAASVLAGSYVYRGGHHKSWVEVGSVQVDGTSVRLRSADGLGDFVLPADQHVAVFAAAGALGD